MFERFTEEARRVVVLAQEEARTARDPSIDGAHLLLGIALTGGPGAEALQGAGVDVVRLRTAIREVGDPGGPLDADALAALGIDLEQVRRTAEAAFGTGALDDRARERRRRASGHLPFTRASKECLEHGLRQALRRGDRTIDSRHLLLGLLDVGEKRTTAVLDHLAVDRTDLRRRLGESDAA
jgi:ATP-dependent Clp protease ATP-binding subunit ClpA